MRRIRSSVLQLSVIALLAVSGLAVNSVARAACTGASNTCFGTNVLVNNTTGKDNTGIGYFALSKNIWGGGNTASGSSALLNNTTGSFNTASGALALNKNTSGHSNTANGYAALFYNTTGTYNTANGRVALHYNTNGYNNNASGDGALFFNTTGYNNTASGKSALQYNTTGRSNTASGFNALRNNTTGIYNTANGDSALSVATTGYRNVALGWAAGNAVTTGSDNIIIGGGNQGLAADAGVIRIGASVYQKRTFIAGIRAVTTGLADAVPVLIDSKGQLGTIRSSRRFKEDIQPMGSVSERLFALRPVTFRYKQAYEDGSKPVQYGLVAEEVAEVFPELVVHGKDGKPETVAYHVLATLLLNELQKEHRVVEALRQDDEVQAARMAALEQQVAVLAQAVERAGKSRVVASTR